MLRNLRLIWGFARLSMPSWAARASFLGNLPTVDGRKIEPKAHALSELFRLLADEYQPIEVETLRHQINGMLTKFGRAAPGSVESHDHKLPGAETLRRARVYVSKGQDPLADQPTLLFFHGGGFVVGTIEAYDSLCAHLCAKSGIRVISFDYRLAPEAPFPAAPNDAMAAYRGLISGTDGLIASPKHLAVGGDSAGGNLTSSLMHSLMEQGAPMPAAQVLIYPAVDITLQSRSIQSLKDQPVLPLRLIEWFMSKYNAGQNDLHNPRLSPLDSHLLAGQPQALIVAAGHDPLWDDAHAYAAKLQEAGVPMTMQAHPSQVHGFVSLTKIIPEGMEATEKIATWLKAAVTEAPDAR